MKTFAQLNKKLYPFEVGPYFSQNLAFFADFLLTSEKISKFLKFLFWFLKVNIKGCLCAEFQLLSLFLSKVNQGGLVGVIFTPPHSLSYMKKPIQNRVKANKIIIEILNNNYYLLY